jgi:AcrR family transcriptional regulator
MTTPRTGAGDPARTLALLWRGEVELPRRRGPRPALDVDALVATAIDMADADGLDALTVRGLARRVGVSPMTLYTYVPGTAELLDVMLDALYLAMPRPSWARRRSWRARVGTVAGLNREHELAALDGLGLTDVQMDAALTFVLAFVQSSAVASQGAAGGDDTWWAAAGPLLAEVLDAERYPLASRVGTAAGQAQDAAFDPDRAYAFGLDRVLDGLAALIER